MESKTDAAVTPSPTGGRISENCTEEEGKRCSPLMLNSPSPAHSDVQTSPLPLGGGSVSQDSVNSPPVGRKRRLSFKEKQRQSISHFGGGSGSTGGGVVQSPKTEDSTSSPQRTDILPTSAQPLLSAQKKISPDGATTTTTTGCVFTALDPTRGVGRCGAARPPHRALPMTQAASAPSSAALSVSSATSPEASPINRCSLPSDPASDSQLLVHSPMLRSEDVHGKAEEHEAATILSKTSSSASPPTATSLSQPKTAVAYAVGNDDVKQPSMEALHQPGDSQDNVVSSLSVSSPKTSSSSSTASPKLSFKDRQRAAAAAAANSRNPSARGLISSPVTQTTRGATAAASAAVSTSSVKAGPPDICLAAASPSVNDESTPSTTTPVPVTAAIVSPTQKSLTYKLSSGAGTDRSANEGSLLAQLIPRLPMERVRAGASPQASYSEVPHPGQHELGCANNSGSTSPQPPVPVAVPPLNLLGVSSTGPTAAVASAAAKPTSLSVSSPSAMTRCTQSAPATSMERRATLPSHRNPLMSGPFQEAEDTTDSTRPTTTNTTVADAHSRSSQAEVDDDEGDDEEFTGLAFTQNRTRLPLFDPDEPIPQAVTAAPGCSRGASQDNTARTFNSDTGTIGGGGARSATMVERSAHNSAGWGGGTSSQRSEETEGESEADLIHVGGGGRRVFAIRRARTGSLGSPPPNIDTVPPSPSPNSHHETFSSSHSPRKVPTSEQTKPAGHGGRATNTVTGHWKQQNKPQQQQQQQRPPMLSSTANVMASQELPSFVCDPGEHSISLGGTHLSRTSRSRARRHRDKMLAPDGAVLSTPRTGRGQGGGSGNAEGGGGGAFANVTLAPRMHTRSHTVDDFTLYAASAGRRGTLTPSTISTGSVLLTNHPLPMPATSPGSAQTVVAATGNHADREHAGPLDMQDTTGRPVLPLSPSTSDATQTGDGSGGRGQRAHSPRSRELFSFPALPPLHGRTSSGYNSALSRVSFAMAAVLSPSGPSAESVSAATLVTVATPNGYHSGDERSSNEASRGNPSEVYNYDPVLEGRGQTTMPEDLDNAGDSDYLLQTYNYYGGETSLSATTAELRKSRRRSSYSSLHYGTMTGYHRRGDSRRPRSGSATQQQQKGWQQRRQTSERRGGTGKEDDNEEVRTRGGGVAVMDEGSNAVPRQGVHSSDNDDEESICEQKGSEEDRDKEEKEATTHRVRMTPHGQHHQPNYSLKQELLAAGGQLMLLDEEDDAEDGALRRTVGMWETSEHIFLPRYELVPEAASKEPLTGPASPNSLHPSCTGSSGKADFKTEGTSPLVANLKSSTSSPKALSSHGRQLTPTVLLSSPTAAAQSRSPFSAANAAPAAPTTPSTENSPSVKASGAPTGPRPSGLVVLPDAANLSDDPGSLASLTFSQFRKTPGQVAGTKRLEPEKFSFGTVADTYNMEPTDEQKLPEGAADAKVAARLIFDATSGVMLMDPEDEGGRYEQRGRMTPCAHSRSSSPKTNEEANGGDTDGEACGDGACQCEASFIAKDFKGLDCSRYDAGDLYDHCSRCHRRPASFLCLHCMEAVCPSHVQRHHLLNPTECTLFLNLLDIMSSFDRIFWCERCKQFTWKYTEVYDALVDQIAYTRGTYLKHPARDIHCVGYEVRLKDAASSAAATASVKARSEPSISEDAAPSSRGSPARLHRVFSGSSLNAALQGVAPPPALTTFPAITAPLLPSSSPQIRSNTPPVHVPSTNMKAGIAEPPTQPAMLGVNNLIVFGTSPSLSIGGSVAAARLHSNTVGTPSLRPLKSPMQNMLSRDPFETSGARAVTVGEPVTKLCALGARVQGWRTTQEDAEAAFLIDIPALSNEVVNRKELRAAAAAVEKKRQQENKNSAETTNTNTLDDSSGGGDTGTRFRIGNEEEASSKKRRSRVTPLEEGSEHDGDGSAGGTATTKETIPMAVFCVFDGHGGDAVAKLAARHFETHLRRAIDGIRADDVRARALLFYLDAESNAAALLGPQPAAVTAIPGADGSVTFLPASSTTVGGSTGYAATQRGVALTPSSPPPFVFASPPHPATSPHSGPTALSSSSHSRLLVPGSSLPRSCDVEDGGVAAPPVSLPPPMQDREQEEKADEENDMPQFLQLSDAMYTESVPVVMPVTTESLRLHMASSTTHYPATTSESNQQRAPPSNLGVESMGPNTFGLPGKRRSKNTLDAWADMEDPPAQQPEMAASMAAVAAAVASCAGSPLNVRPLPPSYAGACVGAGGGAGDGRHFSTTNAQAAMATSTSAFCPSPSAWVSIPEMEMLRQYFASIMEDALLSLDDYLRNTPEGMRGDYDCVGCTACVVGITANFVLCANVGDSGAAFYTKDRIKVISVKHRVSDEAEQKRINAAGYSIVNDRIEGMSAVPRALGDFDFKQCGGRGPHEQAVSAVPDVTIMPTPSDTNQWGIILACDGVWDTATLHQVHVALTNTVNDLDVAGSATDAVLRGAELFQHHLRGPRAPCGESPASLPQCSSPAVEGGASIRASKGATREDTKKPNREREGSISPSPAKRRSLLEEEGGEGSVIGDYDCDEGLEVRRLPQVDPILLTAAAGVFAQCVAPADNDEGVGLDNCSLILIERRNVQE